MALSRFWTIIIVGSIAWIFILLFAGKFYSLTGIVNGKQGEAQIISVLDSQQVKSSDSSFYTVIKAAGENGAHRHDTIFALNTSGRIEISRGTQQADGIFPTCKNTIIDIWLPLIGYLT